MEYIINPRTGRKIMTNGSVWKSLSIEERKEGEKQFRKNNNKVKVVENNELNVVSKVENEVENDSEIVINLETENQTRARLEYISNIEKKTQEAQERVMFLLYQFI